MLLYKLETASILNIQCILQIDVVDLKKYFFQCSS